MTSGQVRGGFNQYGFTVGILMLDTRFPRIPGDMGNAATFPFPVRYQRVDGAAPDLVVRRGAAGLLPAFVEGARRLEREGVGAITTNCGFLVKFQRELAGAVAVPVFTSSLLLVPLVHRLLPPGRRVGIMTVNALRLDPGALRRRPASATSRSRSPGMENEKEFTRVLLGNEMVLDVDAAREEHVRVARRLVEEHPDVGAIVLECTNMPPVRGRHPADDRARRVRHRLARHDGPHGARGRRAAATGVTGCRRAVRSADRAVSQQITFLDTRDLASHRRLLRARPRSPAGA